jgi:hypothetical protein
MIQARMSEDAEVDLVRLSRHLISTRQALIALVLALGGGAAVIATSFALA